MVVVNSFTQFVNDKYAKPQYMEIGSIKSKNLT